jgi:hypothetical protein
MDSVEALRPSRVVSSERIYSRWQPPLAFVWLAPERLVIAVEHKVTNVLGFMVLQVVPSCGVEKFLHPQLPRDPRIEQRGR